MNLYFIMTLVLFLQIYYFFRLKNANDDRRLSIIKSSVIFGVWVLVFTISLSLLHLMSLWPLLITYLISILVMVLALIRNEGASKALQTFLAAYSSKNILVSKIFRSVVSLDSGFIFIIYLIVILALTFIVAAIAAPNNFDSMIYHMSRVVHWVANRSVGPYPTIIIDQISAAPLAEYFILHFQILSGSDYLANMVQWLAFLGSIIGVSYITKELGGARKQQLLAAVFVATAPMAILQSSSTQNDLSVAFWVVCFVALIISEIKSSSGRISQLLLLGSSLGLAINTKGTSVAFVAPFAVWYSINLFKIGGRKVLFRNIVLIGSIALLLNSYFFINNFKIFGNPLGNPQFTEALKNSTISPKIVVSNVARNLSTMMSNQNQLLTTSIEGVVKKIHVSIQQDINDPQSTLSRTSYTMIVQQNRHEDVAGNPIQLLVLLSLAFLAIILPRFFDENVKGYIWSVIFGLIIFSALFKWQPWINRLDLTFIILGAAFVSAYKTIPKVEKYSQFVFHVMVLFALLPLLANETRPLVGSDIYPNARSLSSIMSINRDDQYFSANQFVSLTYKKIVSATQANGCRDVGIVMHYTNEYQLWAIDQTKSIKYYQILVNSDTSKATIPEPQLCAIVKIDYLPEEKDQTEISYKSKDYIEIWKDGIAKYFVLKK